MNNEDTIRVNTDTKPFPDDGAVCTECGERLRLCEGGYIRMWSLEPGEDDKPTVYFTGLEDFTDYGDYDFWVECMSCLQSFEAPEDWESA